jgi:hypothetical protein
MCAASASFPIADTIIQLRLTADLPQTVARRIDHAGRSGRRLLRNDEDA